MTNEQLNIILKLQDEASKQIQQVQSNIEKFGDSLEKVGHQMSQVGRNVTFLGAAITGPLSLAFKTASNYSFQAHDSLQRLEQSAIRLQTTIGTAVAPVFEKLSYWIEALVKWFDSLSPATKDFILQGVLISGIFLTLVGTLTNVIGRITTLAGAMISFAVANPYLLAIVGSLVLMIIYWDKLKTVAIPVLNGIEIGLKIVATGFYNSISFILGLTEKLLGALQAILSWLGKVSEKIGKEFSSDMQNFAESLGAAKDGLDSVRQGLDATALQMATSAATIAETGKGSISGFVDESITSVNRLWEYLKNPPLPEIQSTLQSFHDSFVNTFISAYQQAVNIGQQSASIITNQVNSLSNNFGQVIGKMATEGGKFSELMIAAFRQMAADFIAQVVAMMVKWAAFLAMKAIGSFFGFFHEGGQVMHSGGPVYAHSGLAVDEVPIIAQTGEGILSRRGMSALGGAPVLNLLNRGMAVPAVAGGTSYHTNYIDIKIDRPVVSNREDIDALVEAVSTKLAQEAERL